MNITGAPTTAFTVNGSLPAPTLRWREGDTVTVRVSNGLAEMSSIHWHGIVLPANMDGVPGLSFHGIQPGETYVYRFRVKQGGTYWYHSHSGFQEQRGLYGPLIIDPLKPEPFRYDREHVVMLTDWTDENPERVFAKLKKQSDYYNFHQRTAGDLLRDVRTRGWNATLADRREWAGMRMNPTDIADVSGSTYTYLMNGVPPAGNWTGLFTPGERLRLRIINGSAMSYFDVRIPGLKMTVVAADGQYVHPVTVDEFRIATAETYDVIVEPAGQDAFTIFAQSNDRTGFAAGTLAVREGLRAPVPSLDPRPILTMGDMGHGAGHVGHGEPGLRPANDPHAGHNAACDLIRMPVMRRARRFARSIRRPKGNPLVDMQTMTPAPRLDDPGIGLRNNGRRVLTYADLKSRFDDPDGREPGRDDRTAPDRPHGALCLVVQRRALRRRRAAALHLRRTSAHRARQRHDDDAPDSPPWDVERSGRRARTVSGAQAHDRDATGYRRGRIESPPMRSDAGRITATCCSTWRPACSGK